MKSIYIYGTGGFAKEVAWLVEAINNRKKQWEIKGFLDDNEANWGKMINGYKVLGDYNFLSNIDKNIYLSIAIGNPKSKETILNKLKNNDFLKFATLIHPNVEKSKFIKIGEGSIICAGTVLTTNIVIGEHVIINLDTTIGHDVNIGDYTTILPGANISGNVNIGKNVSVGTGSAIIQNIEIGGNTTIGAGAVVVRNLPSNCTAVGIPAKPINLNN